MIKKIYANTMQVVIGLMLGLFIGIISIFIFDEVNFLRFDVIFYTIVMFVVVYILHIVIHEGGHCLFGLLYGFKFVSFRIGSYIWLNDNGVIRFKRYHMPQTGGQCLMDPPSPSFKAYVLYLLGGGIANLIVGILFILIGWLNKDLLLDLFCFANISIGFLVGFLNLVPMDVGIPNDGLHAFHLFKESKSCESLYKQLKIAKELADGKRIDEMDPSYFTLYENAKLKNPLNTCIEVNKGMYLSALKRYDEAKTCLENLFYSKISPFFKESVVYELMLIELLTSDEPNVVQYYITNIKRKIEKEKNNLSSLMAQYGTELLINKDEREAMVVLKYINDVFKTYPYNTEVAKETIKMLEERVKSND